MPPLPSKIAPDSDAFRANAAAMLAKVEAFRAAERAVIAHSAKAADKFAARGQLLPRERVTRLLDPATPFLELSTLAGLGMHDDDGEARAMGGGSVIGIGVVSGKRVLVSASDSAIKGGTVSPMGLRKALRAQEIALENKLPLIYLVESGGANLLYQAEMFVEGGRSFANQARLSAAGIPQVAVVHGSSTAGGAYLPGLSDYVILVRDRSKIFLAGPPLVKAAIGEDTTDEALGGTDLHASVTGLGEFVARDDAHAIQLARDLLAKLKWDRVPARANAAPPLYAPEEIVGLVPVSEREPYDVREIIARIVDGSDFLDFKRDYGAEMVCGFAAIAGFEIGILGNNGAIQPDGSTKAAQFMQACDQTGTPLVFLQNTTGYMVGSTAERGGAIKHGSKMIQAVANARVPKFTILVGGSYGAGNYGMCGRGFDPRFIFSWPNARVAVMGGPQAAKVMEIITRAKFEKAGGVNEPVLKQMAQAIEAQLDRESTALYATARLWDDGIIDPRDTRAVLSLCLSLAAEADARALRPNAFGVARL
ncbi:acyl-CoA carboxylase subunit beta [Rhodomicrobium lacus]|uniref:acyl-CoA carboxylase subunit beta n=1 Tax=Rhodomicrobium lacus TaxID=2498452 RepID=UPI0026E4302F|nr:carboxyl transferase domain-containing protein [Rhodomicrobium lacus]WKW51966.1 carboxyl transferase domain-containing protein [Rhodomicrobium lacus]